MKITYDNKKYDAIFKENEIISESDELNELISENNLNSSIMICYFMNIDININEILKTN